MTVTTGLSPTVTKKHSMEDHWIWYLAGVFDTAGLLTVKIQKHDQYNVGYDFRPMVVLTRKTPKETVFGMVDELAEEEDFTFKIVNMQNSDSKRLIIRQLDDIETFLELVSGGFIQQQEQAEIMLDEIIPAVRNEKHLTKEGFYELMDAVETLRETSYTRRQSKYTKEYFEEEWADSL